MNGRLSRYALIALIAVTLAVRCSFPQRQVLTWDVFGYYLYLPALFIHDDVALRDQAWLDETTRAYTPSATLYQLVDGPDGARVIKYSSGMAVLYAPCFLVAHVLAEPLGYPADGFSPPYQIAVAVGCLAFALLGLVLFRKVLLHFFDDRWTTILVLLIGLGTNWFQLTAWDGTLLTHPALFTLYAWLLLATVRWHQRPSWAQAIQIGVVLGLITLIRPSELVAVLIPLLWGLHAAADRRAKWKALTAHPLHLLAAAAVFALAVAPQLLYWQATTGQWLFYSYVNPGEGFDFATPHLRPFLISFRKGWFVYTPLMLFAIAGIAVLWKRIPQAFWAVLVFLFVDLWIVSSWSCWWYAGGSFSARSMVPAYVLLALPLGAFLQWTWERKTLRAPLLFTCSAFVVLNLFQTWQWTAGLLSKERMTKAYYKAVFARTQVPAEAERLLLVSRSLGNEEKLHDEDRYSAREVLRLDFSDRPDSVLTLTADAPFSKAYENSFEGLTGKDHVWIRASARFWVGDTLTAVPTLVIHFEHEGGTYKYMARDWSIPAGTKNAWVAFSMDYITPEVRSRSDRMKAYIWNQRGIPLIVDDFVIEVFDPE
jgi:hypothetical protein